MSERTMDSASSSGRWTSGVFALAVAGFAVVLCASLLLGTRAESARGPADVMRTARRSSAVRQVERAASIYELDSPVQLEIRVVRVELSSTESLTWDWKFPSGLLSPSGIETGTVEGSDVRSAGFAGVLESLQGFGEARVLHSGVCLLASGEPTRVYSGRRIPVGDLRQPGETRVASPVQYRDLGQKFTVNLDGVDAQGRIGFTYDIDVSYVEGKAPGGETAPTFVTFNTQSRGKVRDGDTLVIQNIDGSTGLLVFLTPHVME